MQQKWWLIAAGVLGIGLAVLLFPRPDTGGTVPSGADPLNTNPLDFKRTEDGKPARIARAQNGTVDPRAMRREARPPEERLGANPMAGELAKRRSSPEAIFAGRASGPWTIVRRQLLLMADDADAKVLAEELSGLVLALRGLRRDPESGDYATLEQQQRDFLAKVRAHSDWMGDEILVASLERVDGILVEYAQADKTGGTPPETEVAGQADPPEQE